MLNRRFVGHDLHITSIIDNPIIAPVNETVMSINDLFVSNHSEDKNVYVSTAHDYIGRKRDKVPEKVAKKYKNWACTKTDQLPRELKFYVGMPVIVSKNIHTELGMTNGTKGVIRAIHFKEEESVISGNTDGFHHLKHMPDCIVVELDEINVKPLNGLPPKHVPIVIQRGSFEVYMGTRNGKKESVKVSRRHFPLVPRFSCTAHKSQGQTLSKAIIDLTIPTYMKERNKSVGIEHAYVPLSRVRRLEDLTILRTFDPSVLQAKVNEHCAAMMEDFIARDLCKDM
jgi:ATP-dependent exoDNAse (exonuclease V) alpha subunit